MMKQKFTPSVDTQPIEATNQNSLKVYETTNK